MFILVLDARTGLKHEIDILEGSMTIHQIKMLVCQKFVYGEEKIELTHQGIILEDEKSLESYHIKAEQTLYIIHSPPVMCDKCRIV